MSLYGALYSGVSGLTAQANNLGVISDNVSNVNTIGYKKGNALFETLVTSSSNVTAYSPGGVLGGNQQLVDRQGLLQTTSSPTDVAISGGGFFVVNATSDSSGQILYTRAGSFTQDSSGNFRNTAGLYLQAWPLDRDGRLPGEAGNLNTISSANLGSLQTVNVQNLTGTAASTGSVSIGANLDAGQAVFAGAGATAALDTLDTANFGIKGADIIIPTAVDGIVRGDRFTISTGAGLNYTYTYGGFTFGRSVTSGAVGDNAQAVLANFNPLAANPVATTNTSSTVVITAAAHGLVNGQVVDLSGLAATGGITAPQLTGRFIVSNVTANTFEITTTGTASSTVAAGGGAAGVATLRPSIGNILDATNPSMPFLGTVGVANYNAAGLTFTITTAAAGTVTFSYTSTAANAQLHQFNTLNNLADAINAVSGMTARVVNGRLYVGATDANAAMTFANGSVAGSAGPPVLAGVDWLRELGLADVASGSNRFDSLQSLSDLINSSTGLTATVNNPLGSADLFINVDNPLDTITFDEPDAPTNTGSLLSALGLGTSLNSVAYVASVPVGPLGPAYDPTTSATNMASGAIASQFSRPVTVFDALGAPHNLNFAFLKTATNSWAVEVYSQPSTDVTTTLPNGQIANGTITFNGDGSLRSVSSSLTAPVNINWTNGAVASSITFDWGTAGLPFGTPNATAIGKTDGLSQFDSAYNVNFVDQNGAPVGQLTGVSIDEDGFVIASYTNGQTQRLFKIPLASFPDPNRLQSISGNAYTQTNDSGEVNLKQSGQSGVGTFSSGALEASNVELANELTSMIVAQRAYQANTKVISTADQLLSDLGDIIR